MTSISKDGVVEFRFYRKDAQRVGVVGDFMHSKDDAIAMRSESNGWWLLRLVLPPGEHRFHYLADGIRFTDFASHGVEFAHNQWRSVLYVPDPAEFDFVTHRQQCLAA